MEEFFMLSVGFLALLAVTEGIAEGIFSVSPFLAKLGQYEALVKRTIVFLIATAIVFGFGLDYSSELLSANPVTPAAGQVLTALVIGFASSLLHKVVK